MGQCWPGKLTSGIAGRGPHRFSYRPQRDVLNTLLMEKTMKVIVEDDAKGIMMQRSRLMHGTIVEKVTPVDGSLGGLHLLDELH